MIKKCQKCNRCLKCKEFISKESEKVGYCLPCAVHSYNISFSLYCLREITLGGKKEAELSTFDIKTAIEVGLQIKPDFKIKDLYPETDNE
jgi:hypothetical protein